MVEEIIPPITTVAKGRCTSAPAPTLNAIGIKPKLATKAVIHTTQRQLPADAFFKGLFSTALQPGELIVGVHFPHVEQAAYKKFEQPASRFAHPGVAVVCTHTPAIS